MESISSLSSPRAWLQRLQSIKKYKWIPKKGQWRSKENMQAAYSEKTPSCVWWLAGNDKWNWILGCEGQFDYYPLSARRSINTSRLLAQGLKLIRHLISIHCQWSFQFPMIIFQAQLVRLLIWLQAQLATVSGIKAPLVLNTIIISVVKISRIAQQGGR